MLRDPSDTEVLARRADPRVGGLDSGQDSKEGRLPSPVRSDESDPVPLVEGQGEAPEERPLAVRLREPAAAQEDGSGAQRTYAESVSVIRKTPPGTMPSQKIATVARTRTATTPGATVWATGSSPSSGSRIHIAMMIFR